MVVVRVVRFVRVVVVHVVVVYVVVVIVVIVVRVVGVAFVSTIKFPGRKGHSKMLEHVVYLLGVVAFSFVGYYFYRKVRLFLSFLF